MLYKVGFESTCAVLSHLWSTCMIVNWVRNTPPLSMELVLVGYFQPHQFVGGLGFQVLKYAFFALVWSPSIKYYGLLSNKPRFMSFTSCSCQDLALPRHESKNKDHGFRLDLEGVQGWFFILHSCFFSLLRASLTSRLALNWSWESTRESRRKVNLPLFDQPRPCLALSDPTHGASSSQASLKSYGSNYTR